MPQLMHDASRCPIAKSSSFSLAALMTLDESHACGNGISVEIIERMVMNRRCRLGRDVFCIEGFLHQSGKEPLVPAKTLIPHHTTQNSLHIPPPHPQPHISHRITKRNPPHLLPRPHILNHNPLILQQPRSIRTMHTTRRRRHTEEKRVPRQR
jgi:hypothetical protein